jgi:Peptidase family M28
MRVTETVSGLVGFGRRGPGTDAERRAAIWLAAELKRSGREARLEPFWCRPNWALAHAWHVALAIGGSLLAIISPWVGGSLVLVALLSVIADELLGVSLGRRLTPERASQNVVAAATGTRSNARAPVRLIITANYDAGRTGVAYRDVFRRGSARLRRALGCVAPGWLGWTALAMVWLLATALLRIVGGVPSRTIGAIQLAPTVALLITLAVLIDLAGSNWSPAAGDNASGAAVALALAGALDAAPPPGVAVELVLHGAGEGGGIGLRRYLRARRRELRPSNAVVLGIAASGAGRPRWLRSDGAFVPLRYAAALRRLCAQLAADEPHLGAAAHRGRGATAALRARAARLPAISIGCLDERSLVPRSHQSTDAVAAIDLDAIDATLQFGLMLADAIGVFVQRDGGREPASTPA